MQNPKKKNNCIYESKNRETQLNNRLKCLCNVDLTGRNKHNDRKKTDTHTFQNNSYLVVCFFFLLWGNSFWILCASIRHMITFCHGMQITLFTHDFLISIFQCVYFVHKVVVILVLLLFFFFVCLLGLQQSRIVLHFWFGNVSVCVCVEWPIFLFFISMAFFVLFVKWIIAAPKSATIFSIFYDFKVLKQFFHQLMVILLLIGFMSCNHWITFQN